MYYFIAFDFSPQKRGEFSVGITVSPLAEKSLLDPTEVSKSGPKNIGAYTIAAFLGKPVFRWDLVDVDAKTNAILVSLGGSPIRTPGYVAINVWKPSSYDLPFEQIANLAIDDVNEKLRRFVFPKLGITPR